MNRPMTDTPGTLEERAREIAARLSEAQKRAILSATDLMSNHGGYPFFSVEFTEPWNAPVAQFLTLKSDRLTPLGLAVRQALKDTPVEQP